MSLSFKEIQIFYLIFITFYAGTTVFYTNMWASIGKILAIFDLSDFSNKLEIARKSFSGSTAQNQ